MFRYRIKFRRATVVMQQTIYDSPLSVSLVSSFSLWKLLEVFSTKKFLVCLSLSVKNILME